MKWIVALLGTIILTVSQVYSWFNISKTKIKFNENKMYIKILVLILLIFINHNFGIRFIRAFSTIFIAIVFCKIILKLDLKRTILLTFLSQLIIMVSEAIIAGIIVFVFQVNTEIFSTVFAN